jgi:hypothetical protein
MIKRDIPQAGYGKRDPGRRDAQLENSTRTIEATRSAERLGESVTE